MISILSNQNRLFGGSPIFVLAIAGAIFISWQGTMAIPIQIGTIIDGMGISEQRSGFLGTAELTMLSLVTILLATRIGAWSKPRVALTGLILIIVGQLLSAFAPGFAILLICRLTVGAGAGLVYGAACSCIVGHPSGDRVFAWGMAFGQVLLAGMLFGLPFAAAYGFHKGVFVSLGVLAIVFGGLLTALPDRDQEAMNESAASSYKSIVTVPVLVWFFIALCLYNIAIGMLWGFVERRADELHMDAAQVGMILAALPIGGILGSVFAGIIGGRFGRLKPLVLSCLACAASCAAVAFAAIDFALLIAIFALGIFELFVVSFLIGTASTMDNVGRISTLTGGLTLLTYGLGPALGGFLSAQVSVSTICLISSVFCLAAAVIFLPVGLVIDRNAAASTK